MSAMSNYLESALLDHALGTSAMSAPTAVYGQLHTGDPGEDGTSNVSAETTRVELTFGAAASGVAALSSDATWPGWDAGSETITHVSIWDAATTGNCLFVGSLSAGKAVADGDDFVLKATTTTITFA